MRVWMAFLMGWMAMTSGVARGEDFATVFRRLEDPMALTPPLVLHAEKNLHYVFITGLAGDIAPGYFQHAMQQLEELGIPKSSIHLLRPPSRRSSLENARALRERLARIPGRLVVIAHSKGANESFLFAVENPKFIEERIEAMYLMQASYFGSPLADELLFRKTHDISHASPWQRFLIRAEKLRGRVMYGVLFRRGLRGLATKEAGEVMNRVMTANPGSQRLLKERLHFITTAMQGPGLTRLILDLYGDSDGVNPVPTQYVPDWGNHLAHLEAGHVDLILPWGNIARKRALARAIFSHVETKGDLQAGCPWLFAASGEAL